MIRTFFPSNLDEPLPEMLSKTSKRRETSLRKSKKKRQAIASVGSETLGGSWELGSSWGGLGEPGEVSRELWEAPYIHKTPDQPHGGRYVIKPSQLFSSICLAALLRMYHLYLAESLYFFLHIHSPECP